jgi:hypothetical protein
MKSSMLPPAKSIHSEVKSIAQETHGESWSLLM